MDTDRDDGLQAGEIGAAPKKPLIRSRRAGTTFSPKGRRRGGTRHVAFLRAINVGGRTVTMARLGAVFESLGFTGVGTVLASGNVVFESDSRSAAGLERRIEGALERALGYEVRTFLRSPAELRAIVEGDPFGGERTGGARVHVGFLGRKPTGAAARALGEFTTDEDKFRVIGRVLYWLRRGRMSDSDFSGAALEKSLGMAATLRNMNTIERVMAKFG